MRCLPQHGRMSSTAQWSQDDGRRQHPHGCLDAPYVAPQTSRGRRCRTFPEARCQGMRRHCCWFPDLVRLLLQSRHLDSRCCPIHRILWRKTRWKPIRHIILRTFDLSCVTCCGRVLGRCRLPTAISRSIPLRDVSAPLSSISGSMFTGALASDRRGDGILPISVAHCAAALVSYACS
jgi:hypothetical protein